ncbi:MAG TPA: hypothetical protein VGS11_03985 [Candidatus Bathyarchaeia archaeon]|nr:hypothetical protein [Candidatus Bathyarchaeia archaeon]
MSELRDRIQENYRWTAYMKLKGQTWARGEDEILDEFDGFVQSLRGVGIDYHIIVTVDGRTPRQFNPESKVKEASANIAGETSGE